MTDKSATVVERLLHDWQASRSEWHGPTTLDVVREYAEWREAQRPERFGMTQGIGEQSLEERGRPVKRHASGDPFVAREILKRHANFPRVKWEEAVAAIAEALVLAPAIAKATEAECKHKWSRHADFDRCVKCGAHS